MSKIIQFSKIATYLRNMLLSFTYIIHFYCFKKVAFGTCRLINNLGEPGQKTYKLICPKLWTRFFQTRLHFMQNVMPNKMSYLNIYLLGLWGIKTRFVPKGPKRLTMLTYPLDLQNLSFNLHKKVLFFAA